MKNMADFYIVVGTVTGTALDVATSVSDSLRAAGHTAALNDNYQVGDIDRHTDTNTVLLLCTSNTGMGDLPDNIATLLSELSNTPPNIYGRSYTVINLGDSSYNTFAGAGKILDEAFSDLGCNRLGEPLIIDAMETTDPVAASAIWLQQWLHNHPELHLGD